MEAETPEEAIRIFKEDPKNDNEEDGREEWDEYAYDGADEIDKIEVEGYYELADLENGSASMHYIEPVVADPEPENKVAV